MPEIISGYINVPNYGLCHVVREFVINGQTGYVVQTENLTELWYTPEDAPIEIELPVMPEVEG